MGSPDPPPHQLRTRTSKVYCLSHQRPGVMTRKLSRGWWMQRLHQCFPSIHLTPPVLSVSPKVIDTTYLRTHSQVPLASSSCLPISPVSLLPVSSCLSCCEPVTSLSSFSVSTSTPNFFSYLHLILVPHKITSASCHTWTHLQYPPHVGRLQ